MLGSQPIPITRDLVLLGGGHAHALVLLKWAMNPLPGARVTLINPHVKAPYTGMLPGLIAGHYARRDLDIDLVRLARKAGARLILDQAVSIDTARSHVHLASRPDVAYDVLSIDIGITTELLGISGAKEFAVSAKPLGVFAGAWESFLTRIKPENMTPNIAVIGGGVAGIELALAMAHRLRAEGITGAHVSIIESKSEILREIGTSARRSLLRALERYDVKIISGANVEAITRDKIHFASGLPPIPANFVVTAAGAAPHSWLGETGLALHDGYIEVDDKLRSLNIPHIFASGDCAHLSFAPRPKAGVFAVRQAPVLFENLRADLSGQKMRRYRPQKSYLKLISTGEKSAIADKWGTAPKGPWVWQIKDRIDQNFMRAFVQAAKVSPPELPRQLALDVKDMVDGDAIPCGGCGSKLAQIPLMKGLAFAGSALAEFDDAAIIKKGRSFEVISTDHLRAFTHDPYILAKAAAEHALGDIWAMGATPETALSHIILPLMAEPLQAHMLREIMASAAEVFEACGVKIVGGHTSSGADLTIGFTVTGTSQTPPITLSNASMGDRLVLTKPLGTGVLLAAEMRQMADGDDYHRALLSMCRLQGKAAARLAPAASAMTDVTGFGLAGHMMNMLKASDVSAHINLDAVPILGGAEDLSRRGLRTWIWPANAKFTSQMTMQPSAKSDLLFDPQTCGGLLASVPSSKIDKLREDFKSAGEPLWIIGEIKTGPPHITVL